MTQIVLERLTTAVEYGLVILAIGLFLWIVMETIVSYRRKQISDWIARQDKDDHLDLDG